MKRLICFGMLLLILSCTPKMAPDPTSVLWARTAAEYPACGFQTYNAALMNLEAAIADPGWTGALEQTGEYYNLPPAVIFDIDETVLDNSKFQGWLALNRSEFKSEDWERWEKLGVAESIAGAVDFIHHLQDLGITVIFITNRSCGRQPGSTFPCPQEANTIDNLSAVGISGITENHVLLKNEFTDWGPDKTTRRSYIAEKYRIIMIFGDDLGDFISGVRSGITPEKRRELASVYRNFWGEKWFILPNPMYGSWRRVLSEPTDQYLKGEF